MLPRKILGTKWIVVIVQCTEYLFPTANRQQHHAHSAHCSQGAIGCIGEIEDCTEPQPILTVSSVLDLRMRGCTGRYACIVEDIIIYAIVKNMTTAPRLPPNRHYDCASHFDCSVSNALSAEQRPKHVQKTVRAETKFGGF